MLLYTHDIVFLGTFVNNSSLVTPLDSRDDRMSEVILAIIYVDFHRIIGWKRPLRSSTPTIHPTPPCLLQHIPKCHF